MKKIAVFVEGMTEQEFVIDLLIALAGKRGIHIAVGRQFKNQIQITPSVPNPTDEFYVLVVDCCSDGQVKTQIRDRFSNLIAQGYTAIFGLRDVYPFTAAELNLVRNGMRAGLPTQPFEPEMHLAVMETEAWFIAETSHFAKVSPKLTLAAITAAGFDVVNLTPESWVHPAETLDNIYKIAGARYMTSRGSKSRKRVRRTLNAMDLDELYVNVRPRVPDLDRFVSSLEASLFSANA